MARGHYAPRSRNGLSQRQRQVLGLLAQGKTNREIGDALGMTLDGAKFHVSEVMAKLGVATREQAADWWRAHDTPTSRLQGALSMTVLKWAVASGGVAVAVIVGVLVARSLGSSPASEPPVPPIEGFVAGVREPDGLRLIGGGWTWAHLPSEALDSSELVVLGKVTAVSNGMPSASADPFIRIFRVATFTVDEVIKAPTGFRGSDVAVYLPGGEYGGFSMAVIDMGPEIGLGEGAVLFLNRPTSPMGEPGTWVSYFEVKIYSRPITDRGGEAIPAREALDAIRAAAR